MECYMTANMRWLKLMGEMCGLAALLAGVAASASAQTPSPALLVLEKSDNAMAMVDPASMKIVARVPAGTDPHEIVASTDGRVAYISNYGGTDSDLHTISVVDLLAHKELPAIDLGALHSAHGLFYAGERHRLGAGHGTGPDAHGLCVPGFAARCDFQRKLGNDQHH